MTSQVSLKGMIVRLVIMAGPWVVYLSQFVSHPTEPENFTSAHISPMKEKEVKCQQIGKT
ncbi:MAG TPA: hypothetical protein VKA09_09615 [Nitrososphaeraceae archaeon]|nr:hypothetical protein [Nitrososphaeraceae archaeon]